MEHHEETSEWPSQMPPGSTGEKQGGLSISAVFFCSAEATLMHMISSGGAYQEERGPAGRTLCADQKRGRGAGSLPVRGHHTITREEVQPGLGQASENAERLRARP